MSANLKRLLPILLVAIVAGIIAGYLVDYTISSGKIKRLKDELSALMQEHKDLQNKLKSLQDEHRSLEMSCKRLESKYNALKDDYESIRDECEALESQVEYYEGLIEEAGVARLTLSRILFYDSEPPNATIKEPPEYLPGEEVWLYVELRDFDAEKVKGGYAVSVDWHLHVFDEFGAEVLVLGPLSIREVYDFKPNVLWFKARVKIDVPGTYIAVVTAYDRLSLKTMSTVNIFFIALPQS